MAYSKYFTESEKGLFLSWAKVFEGYKNKAYTNKGEKYPTVGPGIHVPSLIAGKVYSDPEILAMCSTMITNIEKLMHHVTSGWIDSCNSNQYMAVFDFCWGHIISDYPNLISAIKDYLTGGGANSSQLTTLWSNTCIGPPRYSKGLKNRRSKEVQLFMSTMDLSQAISSIAGASPSGMTDSSVDLSNVDPNLIGTFGGKALGEDLCVIGTAQDNLLPVGTTTTSSFAAKKKDTVISPRIWQVLDPAIKRAPITMKADPDMPELGEVKLNR